MVMDGVRVGVGFLAAEVTLELEWEVFLEGEGTLCLFLVVAWFWTKFQISIFPVSILLSGCQRNHEIWTVLVNSIRTWHIRDV